MKIASGNSDESTELDDRNGSSEAMRVERMSLVGWKYAY